MQIEPKLSTQSLRDVIMIKIVECLFLGFRLGTKVQLPAFLQIFETNVAHALVSSLWVAQVVYGGLNWKEQRSSTGT